MPVRTHILETSIESPEGVTYELLMSAELAEEAPTITIDFQFFTQQDGNVCEVSVTAEVSNPLEFAGAIIVKAVGGVAFCIGWRFLGSTAKILRGTYNESKDSLPNLDGLARCNNIVERLPGKADEFKAEALSALVGCVGKTVHSWFVSREE